MWFQDLWTYDFRRTEMCVIPYGTQEGEISFCAYNTGVGWRQIVENMHMVATTERVVQAEGAPHDLRGRPADTAARRAQAAACRSCRSRDGNGNGNGRPAAQAGCGSGCGCH